MKSPVTVVLAAAGVSPWVPLDYIGLAFGIGLGFSVDSAASGISAKVQHTFSDLAPHPVTFAQAATTVTITDPLHDLITGDSAVILGSAPYATTGFDGTYPVTVTGVNTYTVTVTPSQSASGQLQVATLRVFDHPTMTGMTARADGNYAFPVKAVRLNVTAWTAGRAILDLIQGQGR